MATSTKTTLTIAAGPGGAGVLSSITGGLLAAPVPGAYNSGTGIHAEIDAIDTLGAANWNQALTITTNLEPCPRCAAILAAFVAAYGWTVEAPKQAFASNYPGAYRLPDAIYNVVAAQLSAGGPAALQGDEATYFEDNLKSLIKGFELT